MATDRTPGRPGPARKGQKAAVYCEACDGWVPVEDTDGRVTCECGRSFVVTITPLPRLS